MLARAGSSSLPLNLRTELHKRTEWSSEGFPKICEKIPKTYDDLTINFQGFPTFSENF